MSKKKAKKPARKPRETLASRIDVLEYELSRVWSMIYAMEPRIRSIETRPFGHMVRTKLWGDTK